MLSEHWETESYLAIAGKDQSSYPIERKAMSSKCCQSCGFTFDQSWTAYCGDCENAFDFDGDVSNALCSQCGQEAFIMKDEVAELCKHCLRVVKLGEENKDEATGLSSLPESGQHDDSTPDQRIDMNYLDELWRFIGCVCGNLDPHSFELSDCNWPTKSYYCLDCKQPYSAFLWETELRWDQCPRCNGANVHTDRIDTGGTLIECQKCHSKVSKRRFDSLHQEVRDRFEADESKRGKPDDEQTFKCSKCGSIDVQFVLDESDSNPCVTQQCGTCKSTEVLAVWDKAEDRFEAGAEERKRETEESDKERKVPEGFEKLSKCCGNFASLHPVEEDYDDDLLVCDQCDQTVSLRSFDDSRIPQTVSALRRAVEGTFSSGKMGQPYDTVKISEFEELKPADQIDFKRSLYSHHAIVEETVPDSKEVRLIEYTGESNRPTIGAFLRQLPSKACIQKSILKFTGKIKECMYRVDYHSLDCFHPKTVLERATKRIGEKEYHVLSSNCEHFINWAKANVKFSRQVEYHKKRAMDKLGLAVVQISEITDKLPPDGPTRAAVDVLLDIRKEMLSAMERSGSASVRDFWCPVRLYIEWSIRGIPLAIIPITSAKTGCKLFLGLDNLLKRVGETAGKVPKKILAIKDAEDDEDKKKEDGQK